MAHTIPILIKEIQSNYGSWGGTTPNLQTIILYQMLKQSQSAPSGTTSTTSASSVASTVSIRGSTGATILTNDSGAILTGNGALEATQQQILNRLPALVSGRVPVNVQFPATQVVSVSNQISGFATESSIATLLQRIPALTGDRIPVSVQFPNNQRVTVDNPISGFANESTLSSILARTPELSEGRLPVAVQFPGEQLVRVVNPTEASNLTVEFPQVQDVRVLNQSDYATQATLESLLARTPQPVEGKTPVSVNFPSVQHVLLDNPTTDHAKEQTLGNILSRTPQLANGKVPVLIEFPANQIVTVSNPISGYATQATLESILARTPQLANGKTPVSVDFPANQQVTVSNPSPPLDISGLSKETTLGSVLAKLPNLVSGKTPVAVDFPANQKVTVDNPIVGFATETTLAGILARIPTLNSGKTPVLVDFPANQRVTVDNPSDFSALGKDSTLVGISAKLPTLVNGKTPVVLDFPTNQQVTVTNPSDVSALGKETTLAGISAKLPTLVNGRTPVVVDFPANQTVTVANPSDVSVLGRETTLNAILSRLPADISRAIAQGFRAEFTTASPLATALQSTPLGDSPLWTVARTKRVEGLEAFQQTFLGRRATAFANNGFTDLAEFDLQTVGNNLRSPALVGTQTLEIVSSNAGDSATGTGVRTVEIMYLDEGFNFRTTTVTLNGTVPVQLQLAGVAIRPTCLLEVQATSYGSAQGAAGNIVVRIPAGGLLSSPQIIDQISLGDTVSLTARCCVPEGYVGYLTDVSGTAITANHEFRLLATVAQSDKRLLDGVFNTIDMFSANAGTIPVNRTLANIELPSRCRVRLASRASATTASASGGFTIVFVKKSL